MKLISYFGVAVWNVMFFIIVILIILGISKLTMKLNLDLSTRKVLRRISIIFVLLTPFIIPIRVFDTNQFSSMSFGFPFGYIEQHPWNTVINRNFPFTTTLINPWGHSITSNLNIRIDLFIVSVISIYFILSVVVYLVRKFKAAVMANNIVL